MLVNDSAARSVNTAAASLPRPAADASPAPGNERANATKERQVSPFSTGDESTTGHRLLPATSADRESGGLPHAVPAEVKRGVQSLGGAIRGAAKHGTGAVQSLAQRVPKVGGLPGAAAVTSAFAAYDTWQEYQRSGLSDATVRTGAGGIGGVAGALKGGAIGASIGAFGGPVGAVVGGVAGAVIGGIIGSSVGQGVADGIAAARDVISTAHIDSVGDAFTVGAEAAWEGAKAFGSTAWNGVSDQVSDIGEGLADAGDWAVDTATEAVEDVAGAAEDAVDAASDAAGDVADEVLSWF